MDKKNLSSQHAVTSITKPPKTHYIIVNGMVMSWERYVEMITRE